MLRTVHWAKQGSPKGDSLRPDRARPGRMQAGDTCGSAVYMYAPRPSNIKRSWVHATRLTRRQVASHECSTKASQTKGHGSNRLPEMISNEWKTLEEDCPRPDLSMILRAVSVKYTLCQSAKFKHLRYHWLVEPSPHSSGTEFNREKALRRSILQTVCCHELGRSSVL